MQKLISKIKEQPQIRIFSIISLIFFCIWLITLLFGNSHIAARTIVYGNALFGDFLDTINWGNNKLIYEVLDETIKKYLCYTPGTFLFFGIFAKIAESINNTSILPKYMIASMFMTVSVCLIAWFINVNLNTPKKIDKILFCLAFFTSSIFLYAYERGNVIVLSVLLSSYFIFYYDSKNKVLKELALIALAIAFMMKISPAILGLLLLYNKDYRSAIRTVIYGILLLVLPAFTYPRGLETLITLKENIELFSSGPLMTMDVSGKTFIYSNFPQYKDIIMNLFRIAIFVILFCSCFYKEKWRKVNVLVLSMIFIQPGVILYGYLYFLPAIMLYFNENKNKIDFKYFIFFLVLFFQFKIFWEYLAIYIMLFSLVAYETIYGIKYFVENHCFEVIKSKIINK